MTGMPERVHVWSYGGGTQSVAIAVLVARGMLPTPERAVFVQLPREMPTTIAYLDAHVRPLLARAGVPLDVIVPPAEVTRDYWKPDDALPLVPAFTASGRKPAQCSGNWKRDVIMRHLRSVGYGPKRPIHQWIGYSVDEQRRAKGTTRAAWAQPCYPLLTMVPLRRHDCRALVLAEGLPEPPRSRCFDCGNQRDDEWREVRDEHPALFQIAVRREAEMRARDPKRDLYLHGSRVPLSEAPLDHVDAQPSLFDAGCDRAGCYT